MRHLLAVLGFAAAVHATASSPVDAQAAPPVTVTADQMTEFAKAWVAVNVVRDKAHANLADPRNKKVEDQTKLRDQLRADLVDTLKAHNFTQQAFDRMVQAVSADGELRKAFEAQITALTGKKPLDGSAEGP